MEHNYNMLMNIAVMHDEHGPREAFRFVNRREAVTTEEVEDFIINFYTQFNSKVSQRY